MPRLLAGVIGQQVTVVFEPALFTTGPLLNPKSPGVEVMKEGDYVVDIATKEEGKIRKIFHDGWLRIRVEVEMSDGQQRHYNFWELRQLEEISSV